MATGIQSQDSKLITVVRLIDGATTATAIPSGAPTETPADAIGFAFSALKLGNLMIDEASIRVRSTAGTTPASCSVRIWNYTVESGIWCPCGIGTGSAKGLLNGGASITETASGVIRHSEPIYGLRHADGIYAQFSAVNTATLIVELLIPRYAQR